MKIAGLQKTTLLDYPGYIACDIFTKGCNFRCPYCHNASLALPERESEELEEEYIFEFLRKRRGTLDGVVVTGGEPLINKDIGELLKKIKELGYKIKLDTNGSNPKKLRELVEAGLVDKVAMDIKNAPSLYAKTVGVPGYDIGAVEQSKEYLLSGKTEYEFRTTVVKGLHTKEGMEELARWIRGAREYYLQQFKDSGDLILSGGLEAFSETELKEFSDIVRPYVEKVGIRGV